MRLSSFYPNQQKKGSKRRRNLYFLQVKVNVIFLLSEYYICMYVCTWLSQVIACEGLTLATVSLAVFFSFFKFIFGVSFRFGRLVSLVTQRCVQKERNTDIPAYIHRCKNAHTRMYIESDTNNATFKCVL